MPESPEDKSHQVPWIKDNDNNKDNDNDNNTTVTKTKIKTKIKTNIKTKIKTKTGFSGKAGAKDCFYFVFDISLDTRSIYRC